MDDPRMQADLFFELCNDPERLGAQMASREPWLELVWPTREQRDLIEDD